MPPVPPGYKSKVLSQKPLFEDSGEEPDQPTPSPVTRKGFEERLIHVILENLSSVTVRAKVIGDLAVHKSVQADQNEEGSLWSVCHVSSQLLITHVRGEGDAFRVAYYLIDNAGDCWSGKTKEQVLAKCPGWVGPWVRMIRHRGSWVEPSEYRRRHG